MIKRVSLVWKRADISAAEFRTLWLGEHAEQARTIPGARRYTIDFVEDPQPGQPSGIATLLFESRAALETAFSDPALTAELARSRAQFAYRVEILLVDEVSLF